jgi:aryl-alcohol dehydrogenase-like predicted oxidoreductase
MVPRPLGRTGLLVSPIGFGAFKIGRNRGIKYSEGYSLPSDDETNRLLSFIARAGINYIDTAPAYGSSEERVGQFLMGSPVECVVSTKVGEQFEDGCSTYDFSADAVRASVERSRRRLGRSTLDLVFVHAHQDDVAILRDSDVVPTLRDLKQSGVLRAIGLSAKTVAGAELALEWADALMVEYNVDNRSFSDLIRRAHRAGIGLVVKKGLASGHLPPGEAVRFVLQNKAVDSLLISSLSPEHIAENVRSASDPGQQLDGRVAWL